MDGETTAEATKTGRHGIHNGTVIVHDTPCPPGCILEWRTIQPLYMAEPHLQSRRSDHSTLHIAPYLKTMLGQTDCNTSRQAGSMQRSTWFLTENKEQWALFRDAFVGALKTTDLGRRLCSPKLMLRLHIGNSTRTDRSSLPSAVSRWQLTPSLSTPKSSSSIF